MAEEDAIEKRREESRAKIAADAARYRASIGEAEVRRQAEWRKRHPKIYSDSSRREFEERYGKEHGDLVWRETLGKVAREQAAKSPSGVKVEQIPGHISYTEKGKREWVRPHEAYVEAHPHGSRHHGGKCSSGCRRGIVPHRHRRGSKQS